jgi:ribonucleoside-triphosphate reductase
MKFNEHHKTYLFKISIRYVLNYIEIYRLTKKLVVTVNLPDIALSSKGDVEEFWKLFEERTELAHKALRCRHERLLDTPSDVAPILWQYGALARLEKGEKINKLLMDNYSTISLG